MAAIWREISTPLPVLTGAQRYEEGVNNQLSHPGNYEAGVMSQLRKRKIIFQKRVLNQTVKS